MGGRRQRRTSQKSKMIFIIAIVIVELLVFASGYFVGRVTSPKTAGNKKEITSKTEDDTIEQEIEQGEAADTIMQKMSLSDMVYQMMFVTPESITKVGTAIKAGESTKAALEKYPVGGIIYSTGNLKSREQTIEMLKKTQEYSKIPLFISVDEEGGRVARLGNNAEMGTTKHPSMQTIGETGDPQKAYEVGQTMGKELKELGFNVDFAPDADVLINKDNEEIGDRSFGAEPEMVASMVENFVRGIQENGVSATLKHFPGQASSSADPHKGISESARTLEQLRETEFLPFKAGIAEDADFVMVSHMTLVNALEEKVPASVSKEVITDLLINELKYEGIIITDAFVMGAITGKYKAPEAAIMAIKAGADMILMSPDTEAVHDAIVKAVESGEIPRERIEESVRKILKLKIKKNLFAESE